MMMYLFSSLSLSAALVAGVFLTFSDFVMPSLRATPGAGGIAAMQEINRQVYRTVFMVLLIGLAPVSVALSFWALVWAPALVWPLGIAAVSWLTLVIGVSAVGNIPMNEHLAKLPAGTAVATDYWRHYVPSWSRWNHLRVLGCTASAAAFGAAALQLAAL